MHTGSATSSSSDRLQADATAANSLGLHYQVCAAQLRQSDVAAVAAVATLPSEGKTKAGVGSSTLCSGPGDHFAGITATATDGLNTESRRSICRCDDLSPQRGVNGPRVSTTPAIASQGSRESQRKVSVDLRGISGHITGDTSPLSATTTDALQKSSRRREPDCAQIQIRNDLHAFALTTRAAASPQTETGPNGS